jgi:quinol monooxygenase YgiN
MLIVHVHVHVKPERVADFIQASVENASNSIQEPGIERFDVLQQNEIRIVLCWWRSIAMRTLRRGTERPRTTPPGAMLWRT